MGDALVAEVFGISGRDPLVCLSAAASLAEVVHFFTLDVHRCPVVDHAGKSESRECA